MARINLVLIISSILYILCFDRRASLIGKAADLKSAVVKHFRVRVSGPPPGNIHRDTTSFFTANRQHNKKYFLNSRMALEYIESTVFDYNYHEIHQKEN